MFPKVVLLVIAVGAGACTLLGLRQSRLQVASELAQSQLRVCEADERLWLLRSQVAAAVTPQSVERLARALGTMKPIREGLPASALAGATPPGAAPLDGAPKVGPVVPAPGERVAQKPARASKPGASKPKAASPGRGRPAGNPGTTRVAQRRPN
ncbi:MAG: hypothetical protein DYG92_00860 [Leptolyngbya sp. PLA1]|nr:hypothetical protein [Leptolyngbya sp. PLA1]